MIALKQGNENAQNNMIASFSFASKGICNSMFKSVGSLLRMEAFLPKNDLHEEGLDLELTIKFSASTGKDYCESTGKCNSVVELFTSSSTERAEIWIIQGSRAKNTVNEQPNISLRVITKPFMTLMNPSTSNRQRNTVYCMKYSIYYSILCPQRAKNTVNEQPNISLRVIT